MGVASPYSGSLTCSSSHPTWNRTYALTQGGRIGLRCKDIESQRNCDGDIEDIKNRK